MTRTKQETQSKSYPPHNSIGKQEAIDIWIGKQLEGPALLIMWSPWARENNSSNKHPQHQLFNHTKGVMLVSNRSCGL